MGFTAAAKADRVFGTVNTSSARARRLLVLNWTYGRLMGRNSPGFSALRTPAELLKKKL